MESLRKPEGAPSNSEVVSMNYRYAGAWNEVNTRIAQRQNALSIYVTLASVVVTVLFASGRTGAAIDPNLFSLLLPLVSLSFAFLHLKHDRTIAILRDFLAQCEDHSAVTHPELQLLAYNSSEEYMERADWFRKFHDLSSALLVAVFNVIGGLAAHSAYPDPFDITRWPIALYVLLAIVAFIVTLISTAKPHRFQRRSKQKRKGAQPETPNSGPATDGWRGR